MAVVQWSMEKMLAVLFLYWKKEDETGKGLGPIYSELKVSCGEN